MASRNRKPKGDPLNTAANDGQSINATDLAVFGPMGSSNREVVKELLIDKIWPDLRQPRKTIPPAVRGKWDGNPEHVGHIFNRWVSMAGQELGEQLSVSVLLQGVLDGEETYTVTPDKFPIAASLMELISLAASILRDGMINPITVIERGKHWMIETGERRWLAHHLLSTTVQPEEYTKIKTRIVKGNVWLQAAENGNRRPLNAIGMARQLALLLMDMYAEDQTFDEYEALVEPGECDQVYYRQATDLRIKRGYGQRVLDATGLKSRGQVGHYRSLLTIPEWLWSQADIEDWTENRIRETDQDRRGVRTNSVLSTLDDDIDEPDMFTVVNISPDSTNARVLDALRETFDAQPVESTANRAQPTGNIPNVDPSKAAGREWIVLTVIDAKEMNTDILLDIAKNPTSYRYTNPVAASATAMNELIIRGELEVETTPEPTERALEDETPIVGHNIVSKNILHSLMWAAGHMKEGVLEKDIIELATLSPDGIREWIVNNDKNSDDMDWYRQLLDDRFTSVMNFVQALMTEFFTELWEEGQRLNTKYRTD